MKAAWAVGLGLVLMASGAGEASARQSARCVDFSFPVYFKRGSTRLTPAADAAILAAARQFRHCSIASITVVGLPVPRAGADHTQLRLLAVAAKLRAKGLRHPAARIAAAVVSKRRSVIADAADVEITMTR